MDLKLDNLGTRTRHVYNVDEKLRRVKSTLESIGPTTVKFSKDAKGFLVELVFIVEKKKKQAVYRSPPDILMDPHAADAIALEILAAFDDSARYWQEKGKCTV